MITTNSTHVETVPITLVDASRILRIKLPAPPLIIPSILLIDWLDNCWLLEIWLTVGAWVVMTTVDDDDNDDGGLKLTVGFNFCCEGNVGGLGLDGLLDDGCGFVTTLFSECIDLGW